MLMLKLMLMLIILNKPKNKKLCAPKSDVLDRDDEDGGLAVESGPMVHDERP